MTTAGGTALRLGLTILAIAIALVLFAFRNPITNWYKQRAADAEAGQEHARDDAEGRGLEVQGTTELSDAAAALQSAARTLERRTNELDTETREDPAVATRLPDSELARLRAHDRQLCGSLVRCDDRGAAAPGGPVPGGGDLSP